MSAQKNEDYCLTINSREGQQHPLTSLILTEVTAAGSAGRSLSETYLLRCGHEVDGGVVAVVLLRQAEGELVVDEEGV